MKEFLKYHGQKSYFGSIIITLS
uniref:Uncharacterized protein n=1 Tax=Arundo donax TaxID=35708 RepID=A0A0A9ABK9_ARUDO